MINPIVQIRDEISANKAANSDSMNKYGET